MSNFKSFILILLTVLFFDMLIISCSSQKYQPERSKYSNTSKRHPRDSKTKERTAEVVKTERSKSSEKPSRIDHIDQRQQIVKFAVSHKGAKYKSGGKSPDLGFDCSGFTGYVFTNNGIPLNGPSHKLALEGTSKPKEKLMPGDLVFFGNKERISHVAIVAENNSGKIQIVHATTSAGVKIDDISTSEYWQSRFLFGRDVLSR